MKQEQLEMLARIYNTLMTVDTRGENTLIMADCLKALQQVIISGSEENVDNSNLEIKGE